MLEIRMTGHSHDYPVCDVVRLLTGVIPQSSEGHVSAQVPFDAVIESRVIPGKEVVTEVLSGFPDLPAEKRCIREMLLGPENLVTKDGLPVSREVKRQLYALLRLFRGVALRRLRLLVYFRRPGLARIEREPERTDRHVRLEPLDIPDVDTDGDAEDQQKDRQYDRQSKQIRSPL